MKTTKQASKEVTSIQLDIVWPDSRPQVRDLASLTARTRKWAARFGVKATLVKAVGPGGGHPLYRFRGPQANLLRLARNYCGGDGTEARFLVLGEE